MASKSIYQTSLISYLKDIKKMNYEFENFIKYLVFLK